MADISKIQTKGTTYDIKDAEARDDISSLNDDLANIDILGGSGTEVPDGADLNDYTTPGKYYSNNGTPNIQNAPFSARFNLFVISVRGSSNFYMQLLIRPINNAVLYIRYGENSSGWYSWLQISTTTVSTSSVGDPVVMEDEESTD